MLNPDREDLTKYSYILAGIVSLMGVFKLMSYSEVGILDGIFTAATGAVLFIMARMLSQGKMLALYLSALVTVTSLWYSLQLGRFGNLALTALGALWCFWLYGYRTKGELK
jgi:uncharacterized membrane protein (UPF0136 family)